jgi:hypothetical protein
MGAPNEVSFLLGNNLLSWDSICDVSIQGDNFLNVEVMFDNIFLWSDF